MIGWLISSIKLREGYTFNNQNIININGFSIVNSKFRKFSDMQLDSINDKGYIATSGMLTNKDVFCRGLSLEDTLFQVLSGHDWNYLESFRGPFCGCAINFKANEIIAFTNHMGDRPVYYYYGDDGFIVSSNLYMLAKFAKLGNVKLELDEKACGTFLEYGFQIDEITMLNNVKRLVPGTVLQIKDDKIELVSYYKLTNKNETTLNEDEIIDTLDGLFQQAVKRSFELDKKYGYKHLADISGGLDSRMLAFCANKLGYTDILNISYGLPNCFDNKISSRIASDLGHSYVFYSISDLKFIYYIEEAIERNFGCAVYFAPTGSLPITQILDTSEYAIRNNGNFGDSILGGYLRGKGHAPVGDLSGPNYSRFKWRKEQIDFSKFENEEIQNLYSRYLLADPASHFLVQDDLVAYSPFMDVDFVNFVLSIPAKYRYNKQIYFHWLNKKYPEAQSKYPYNSYFFKPRGNYLLKHYCSGAIRRAFNLLHTIGYKLKLSKYENRLTGMNPYNALIERNKDCINFIERYFSDNRGYVKNNSIHKMLMQQYNSKSYVDKLMVLHVIAFAKLYL